MVAARGPRAGAGDRHAVVHRDGAAAARALRRRDARGRRGRRHRRRIQRRLRRPEGARGRRPGAARLLRRASAPRSSRCRRRSSCCARCASCPRSRRSLVARGHRPGQSVRHDLEVARAATAGRRDGRRRDARRRGRSARWWSLVNGALAAYIPRGGRQLDRLPARRRAGAIDDRRGRWRARSPALRARRAARRTAASAEINGRQPAEHPLAPLPHRGRLQSVRDGLPDAPAHLRRDVGGPTCLKATHLPRRAHAPPRAGRPRRSYASSRCCRR